PLSLGVHPFLPLSPSHRYRARRHLPSFPTRRSSDLADRPLVVLDIPLLFEKGGVEEVDAVLVVSAPPEIQQARVLARPGMTAERFAQVQALQTPDAEKRARADYVIDTGTPLAETDAAVARLVDKLTEGACQSPDADR